MGRQQNVSEKMRTRIADETGSERGPGLRTKLGQNADKDASEAESERRPYIVESKRRSERGPYSRVRTQVRSRTTMDRSERRSDRK